MSVKTYIERKTVIEHCKALADIEWNKKASPVSWSDAYKAFADDIEGLPVANVVSRTEHDALQKSFYELETECAILRAFKARRLARLAKLQSGELKALYEDPLYGLDEEQSGEEPEETCDEIMADFEDETSATLDAVGELKKELDAFEPPDISRYVRKPVGTTRTLATITLASFADIAFEMVKGFTACKELADKIELGEAKQLEMEEALNKESRISLQNLWNLSDAEHCIVLECLSYMLHIDILDITFARGLDTSDQAMPIVHIFGELDIWSAPDSQDVKEAMDAEIKGSEKQ
ncbi:MAG: hypothetical protein IKA41_02895 [Bacteroidaceae bacterium]|nr:hypothetical protein [Bacteroidaceae bacterium]